jgi:hypothetical protein
LDPAIFGQHVANFAHLQPFLANLYRLVVVATRHTCPITGTYFSGWYRRPYSFSRHRPSATDIQELLTTGSCTRPGHRLEYPLESAIKTVPVGLLIAAAVAYERLTLGWDASISDQDWKTQH